METTSSQTVTTSRLVTHFLESGEGEPAVAAEPVVFVHGNLSDASVWREQLALLPGGFRGIAPDLRGFGLSEPATIDATRGLRDFADDLAALLDTLGLDTVHLAGHSTGGGVIMDFATAWPDRVRTLTLVAPVSPYGFGGTKLDGTPCAPDFAGSGGGTANPDLVRLIREQDHSADHPLAPRSVIRSLFFPTEQDVRDGDGILAAMLRTGIGDAHYPGDAEASPHWPGTAPGTRGVLNALSPKYCDLTGFAAAGCAAPVLWIRGDQDAIVSDASMVDLGHLGAIGAVPGWPGEEAFPAQPMVAQTRQTLERYAAAGAAYREEVFDRTGHFAFTQRPKEFAALLHAHLGTGS
jgi:pimeloyl-ACP methyl ester carboxylesterase